MFNQSFIFFSVFVSKIGSFSVSWSVWLSFLFFRTSSNVWPRPIWGTSLCRGWISDGGASTALGISWRPTTTIASLRPNFQCFLLICLNFADGLNFCWFFLIVCWLYWNFVDFLWNLLTFLLPKVGQMLVYQDWIMPILNSMHDEQAGRCRDFVYGTASIENTRLLIVLSCFITKIPRTSGWGEGWSGLDTVEDDPSLWEGRFKMGRLLAYRATEKCGAQKPMMFLTGSTFLNTPFCM